jgi:PAS domain S-box-containing protein
LSWLLVIAWAVGKLRRIDGIVVAISSLGAVTITLAISAWAERARWRAPMGRLTAALHAMINDKRQSADLKPHNVEFAALVEQITVLAQIARQRSKIIGTLRAQKSTFARGLGLTQSSESLTRSGHFDAPPSRAGGEDPKLSGDYSTLDMVNRLEPTGLRWIESSQAEQSFLGWTLAELRRKSFLDVIHREDQPRAREMFCRAIDRGEALGVVVRLSTAQGEMRAIEVNVGARYGTNQRISHLRCHLTDVTEKLQAEREQKLRTRELTQVNEQLRRINRELEELKDRYSDLYENAPAMYFSVDPAGVVIECNETMLSTLIRSRDELLGQSLDCLYPEASRDRFADGYREFLRTGSVETETRWLRSNGEPIDVWLIGSVVKNAKGSIAHARFVAQDVTSKRRLEAELREKNERLAQTNDELSQKNRELDEFVYVVSHDLQEPLRTLIAFSDFLLKDYGERLEPEGREFVRHLVDASRRMRAMILGMLNLSRAGKVIGEFEVIDLEDLVTVIRTDLGELLRSKSAQLLIARPLPKILGDRDRIGQLLVNLISNGVKYNKSSVPYVEVGAVAGSNNGSAESDAEAASGPNVTIYVRDNGIGIEPQFHSTIFQLFRRLHSQDEFEGTGVGLSICGKIVQAHGGRIWVESSPGRGSTFFIRLRRSSSPVPAPTT